MRPLPLLLLALGLGAAACKPTAPADAPRPADSLAADAAPDSATTRVVTLGAAVTETAFALGAGDAVVAVDQSSLYPEAARTRPQVGYFRVLGAEALLSARPTLVLAADGSGPPPTLAQVQAAGVTLVQAPGGARVNDVAAMIVRVADALGRVDAGKVLVDTLRAQVARAEAAAAAMPARPKAVFVQAQERGAFGLAGDSTAASSLFALAGADNAVRGFEGYRPVTAEALAAARPDVVVVTARTAQMAGGAEALLRHPGLAGTPAAKAGRVIVLDDADLAFGPRLGEAALKLNAALRSSN